MPRPPVWVGIWTRPGGALIAGRSGIRRHASLGAETFLQDIGGLVEDFGPGAESEDPAISKLPSRFLHLSMSAARAAWADAGLDRHEGQFDPDRVAVVVGSAFGGLDVLDSEQAKMLKRRSLAVSPYLVPAMIINQAAGQIAQHLAAVWSQRGSSERVRLGRACDRAGCDVPPLGRRRHRSLRRGESAFTPAVVNGFATMKALSGTEARRSLGGRSGPGQSAVQHRPRGFRPRGRRGGFGFGDRGSRPSSGVERAGRAGRLVHEFRRLPHGHAISRADRTLSHDRARTRGSAHPNRSITTTLTAPVPFSTTRWRPRS